MTSLKRTLLSLVIVLAVVTAFASVATAVPIQRPYTPCISTRWQVAADSGWVQVDATRYIFAQVGEEVDASTGIWCGHTDTVAGVKYTSSTQTCATEYATAWGFDSLGIETSFPSATKASCGKNNQIVVMNSPPTYTYPRCQIDGSSFLDGFTPVAEADWHNGC